MIQRIEGLPDGAIGFEASGEVSADDYEEMLVPAIERELERHEELRLLYVLGPDFEGYSAGALWDDAKVGMKHLFAWERLAVVTDDSTLSHAVKAFGFMMPAEVRVFPTAERPEAESWIGASD